MSVVSCHPVGGDLLAALANIQHGLGVTQESRRLCTGLSP